MPGTCVDSGVTVASHSPDVVHLVSLETRHFSFKAAARTKDEALQGLFAAWREHRAQAGADRQEVMPSTLPELEEASDMQHEVLRMGQGYRDGQALPAPSP